MGWCCGVWVWVWVIFFCIPTQTSFYIGSEVLYFCVVLLAIFVRFLPFVYALHAMHNTNKKKNKGKLFVASVVPLLHPKKKKIYREKNNGVKKGIS